MPSGRGEGDERYVAGGERQGPGRVAPRGAVPYPDRAPADPEFSGPEVEPELAELAMLLRRAGSATPGPDPQASARMRARLMEAISPDGPDAATSSFPSAGGHSTEAHSAAGRDEDAADGSVGGTRPLRVARVGGSEPEAGGRGTGLRHGSRRRGASRPADNRPDDGRPQRDAGVRRRGARRILSASTMAMCAVLLLGALTVVLSRGALPGEMLYGLKRASESTEVGLTSGQEAKATKHLDIAATRLDEVSELISRGGTSAAGSGPVAAGVDDADAALITDNLRAFDDQARQGARLLLPLTSRPAGPSPAVLGEWARRQSDHLNTVAPSLPESGRTQLASSRDLMDQMSRRADALGGDRPCSATSAGEDELGPLPSTAGCGPAPAAVAPAPATTTPESTSATRQSTSTTGSTTTTRQSTSTSETTDQRSDSSQSRSTQQAPSIEVRPPSIPLPVPVPGLPKVDLPPILPGLPGISLGG